MNLTNFILPLEDTYLEFSGAKTVTFEGAQHPVLGYEYSAFSFNGYIAPGAHEVFLSQPFTSAVLYASFDSTRFLKATLGITNQDRNEISAFLEDVVFYESESKLDFNDFVRSLRDGVEIGLKVLDL